MSKDITCLSYWFPILQDAGLPVPRTEIVRTDILLGELMAGMIPKGYGGFLADLNVAIAKITDNQIPTPPVFLRTGHGSGKHDWSNTCCLDLSKNTLPNHIWRLFEWSHEVDFLGLPTNVWAVREMLPVTPLFRCTRYGEMPFVREYRCFVDGPKIDGVYPYWPEESVRRGRPDRENWRDLWLGCYGAPPPDQVIALASKAGASLGGQWSVDVLETRKGWYVTDCAEAHRSWRWDPKKDQLPWEPSRCE